MEEELHDSCVKYFSVISQEYAICGEFFDGGVYVVLGVWVIVNGSEGRR